MVILGRHIVMSRGIALVCHTSLVLRHFFVWSDVLCSVTPKLCKRVLEVCDRIPTWALVLPFAVIKKYDFL